LDARGIDTFIERSKALLPMTPLPLTMIDVPPPAGPINTTH
jgi:hypothetical protein